uniref:B-cell antigen receptor complex-associated protein beta chain n=1 Tax=Anas platyrhynchos TaxID=8839 RepID=A0A8B9TBX2_ANAPL
MADFCRRLWVLQANLWLMALAAGRHPTPALCNGCRKLHQHPRYVAAKRNTPISFICYTPEPQSMQWYKTVEGSDQVYVRDQNTSRFSDNGIYACDRKNLKSENKRPHMCGTELRVMGHSNIQQIRSRNTLKDAIIIIQSILLVVFISVPMLLFLDKGEGKESPEEDHTYEGLEVEQMATYEDITPFRDVKAKWTVGEHPGEE